MNHRLAIIFYGSSPGTGKSTLSSFLYEQLTLHNIPAFWLYEDDVLHLPYFAAFVKDILSGNPKMAETLMQATRNFVQACQSAHSVAITDSVYPCVNWLISTNLYSYQEIAAICAGLEQLLAPLHPLIIFLDADPKVALQRAIDQRGEAWFTGLVEALNSYAVNRERPLHTLDEVAEYFRIQAALSLEVLQRGSSELLLIDTIETPVAGVKAILLNHLGLTEIEAQPSPTVGELARFAGRYYANESVPLTNPLLITRVDGKLWINSYWPNGCPLVPEGDNHFRLENTSHRLHFEGAPDGSIRALTYRHGDNDYHFVKGE